MTPLMKWFCRRKVHGILRDEGRFRMNIIGCAMLGAFDLNPY